MGVRVGGDVDKSTQNICGFFYSLDKIAWPQKKENGLNQVDDDKSDYESDWEAEIDSQGEVFHIQPMPEFTASPEIPLKSREIQHLNCFVTLSS